MVVDEPVFAVEPIEVEDGYARVYIDRYDPSKEGTEAWDLRFESEIPESVLHDDVPRDTVLRLSASEGATYTVEFPVLGRQGFEPAPELDAIYRRRRQ